MHFHAVQTSIESAGHHTKGVEIFSELHFRPKSSLWNSEVMLGIKHGIKYIGSPHEINPSP